MSDFELVEVDYESSSNHYWYDAAPVPAEGRPEYWHPIYPDPCEECGGVVVSTGGNGYYNGRYQCYTLYLCCEVCGPYDVECV